jgi:hypothetical protein
MSTPETPEFPTELWCAGLPLVECRPLDEAERARIASRAARLLRLLIAIAIFGLAVLAWPFALAATPAGGALFQSLSGIDAVWFTSWIVFLPACVMLGGDLSRNWARRLADLRSGESLVFGGRVPDEPLRTAEQRRLLHLGLLTPWANEEQRLVVFAGSRSLLARDPQGRDVFIPAWVHEVAPGPAYALRVPVPAGFGGVKGRPDLQFDRRALAEGEVAELRAYVSRLRRVEFVQVLGALSLLYAVSRAVEWMRAPAAADQALGDSLSAALAAFVGGWTLMLFARRLRYSDRLARDVTTGWALSQRRDEGTSAPEAAAPAGFAVAPDAPPVEFLPHSGAVWMDRGRPARWRDLKRAA